MTYNGNAAQPSITWDRPKLEKFKLAVEKAAKGSVVSSKRLGETGNWKPEHNIIFEFDGHKFVLGYAKYLIEYLEGALPKDLTTVAAPGKVVT